MKRVWIVNPFDNLPLEGYRPMRYWLMAEAFAAAGCEVTLWTGDFSHFAKRRRVLAVDRPAPFAVRMLRTVPYRRNVSLRRLYSHWRLAREFARAAGSAPRPDLIVASSPPLALAAAARRHARAAGAGFVLDVMDAWPETFERVVPRWLLWPLRRTARANYRGADLVTVVAGRYADLVRAYGANCPVELFYHGIELRRDPPDLSAPPDGSVRMVYAGSLGMSYDLATVLKALALLPERFTLAVAGAGARLAALRGLAGRIGVAGRVDWRGYLDAGALAELLGRSHIGIVPLDGDSCVGVPYKLADYADAGLAVASSLAGETADLLERYRAGLTYRRGDPRSAADAMARLAGDLAARRAGARRLAVERFDARAIYAAYCRRVLA